MKSILTSSFAAFTCFGLILASAATAQATDFTVDPAHSSMGFSIRHMLTNVQGNFKTFEGDFSFDEKKPENAKAELSIDAASISTNNDKRDGHLRSPDFFDADKFKKITFKSRKITKEGDKKYQLEGELTMHGVSKSIPLTVEYMGMLPDPMSPDKKLKAGFHLTGVIHRKDFGISWNKAIDSTRFILGDDVNLDINVEGNQK